MSNWGIIGTGTIARQFANDIKYASGARLAAVASRTYDSAKKFADEFQVPVSYGSYEALFSSPEVDVVYIATPHNFHFENCMAAIKNGKSILCEKPITISSEALLTLTLAAKEANVFLMEGMWTYFLPAFAQAGEWLKQGRIGEPLTVKSEFGYPIPFDPEGRMYNPELAGGAIYDLGIYNIAAARYFFGSLGKLVFQSGELAETGVESDCFAVLDYENNRQAHLHCSFNQKLKNSTILYGTEGTIEIKDFWRTSEARLYKIEQLVDHYHDTRKGLGFEYQIEHVEICLLEGLIESPVVDWCISNDFQRYMALLRNGLEVKKLSGLEIV